MVTRATTGIVIQSIKLTNIEKTVFLPLYPTYYVSPYHF